MPHRNRGTCRRARPPVVQCAERERLSEMQAQRDEMSASPPDNLRCRRTRISEGSAATPVAVAEAAARSVLLGVAPYNRAHSRKPGRRRMRRLLMLFAAAGSLAL